MLWKISMKVKIYGERHSGTNYLEKLIETNLKADVLKFNTKWWSILLLKLIKYDPVQDILLHLQRKKTLGWKHGCPPINTIESYNSDSLIIITITKNPYSFLFSLFRKPYHIKGTRPASLSSFIRQKWMTRQRDLCKKKYLDSPIELWNLKNKSFAVLKSQVTKTVINITYEELIKNPEQCIRAIASKGNIEFTNGGQFQNCIASTKDSELQYKDYKRFYLNEEWISEFNEADITFINPKIDDKLMEHFNYQKIQLSTKSSLIRTHV